MWNRIFKPVDQLIDGITMYRLLLYYLIALLLAAAGLSAFGVMHYNPVYILLSGTLYTAGCWFINRVFAFIFDAPINQESSLLTGLILSLIITPDFSGQGAAFMAAACGLAMASKYVLTIRHKHIFNPAAIAVVLTALGGKQSASWWIGASAMLPFVIVGGILVARKTRRGRMVCSFLAAAMVATAAFAHFTHAGLAISLHSLLFSSGVFFLGFVMLTEPYTSPTTAGKQAWYAALVGVLLPPQVHLLSFYTSPEISLVIGNLFAYAISPKTKLFPVLRQKRTVAKDTADFVYDPGQKFTYQAGQYMEFTLPHHKADIRGNRRYFTLASSPTEPDIRLGVKFYAKGSSFKKALLSMTAETPMVAAQLTGDFVLPKDKTEKLVFIAGGIGVTPYRSMVKYLLDTKEQRSIRMLYSVRTPQDIAYREIFEEARQRLGLQTTYAITDTATVPQDNRYKPGYVDAAMIKAMVPDYAERTFYISGPQPMVEAVRESLASLGVTGHRVKLDFFPGYA